MIIKDAKDVLQGLPQKTIKLNNEDTWKEVSKYKEGSYIHIYVNVDNINKSGHKFNYTYEIATKKVNHNDLEVVSRSSDLGYIKSLRNNSLKVIYLSFNIYI